MLESATIEERVCMRVNPTALPRFINLYSSCVSFTSLTSGNSVRDLLNIIRTGMLMLHYIGSNTMLVMLICTEERIGENILIDSMIKIN